jgi:hypothetical protein
MPSVEGAEREDHDDGEAGVTSRQLSAFSSQLAIFGARVSDGLTLSLVSVE